MSKSGSDQKLHGDRKNLILCGKIVKPQGIKGEIKVYPFSGNPENFAYYTRVMLSFAGDDRSKWFDVLENRSHGQSAIVRLAGIDSRNDAEAIVGSEVWVDPEEIPPLEDGEFYWHELEGTEVVTSQGQKLGRVKKIFATGGHDILVVSGKGQEYLIPALDEFIVEINEESGTVVVDLPEGLLEINN